MLSLKNIVLLVLVFVCLALLTGTQTKEGFREEAPTIFVSCASYRDEECSTTLQSAFENADNPSRVFFGVCEQNSDNPAEKCSSKYQANVRTKTLKHTEAKGPTYARYICSTLYNGETYFLQIDSHTTFVKGWDTACIAMLERCPNPSKAVLTTYPLDSHAPKRTDGGIPVLCRTNFNKHKIPTFVSVIGKSRSRPTPAPYASGGFIFARGTVLKDVPYDPTLDHLFAGEEILYSARLFTSGYSLWNPFAIPHVTDGNVISHHYKRASSPKYWEDVPDMKPGQLNTIEKVKHLLKITSPPILDYTYGMGSKRSLEDYFEYAGIDIANQTSTTKDTYCF